MSSVNSEERSRVLVVDDEENIRESLRLILGRNFEVGVAENGEQALEILESQSALPQLMIVDVMMPGIGGLALLERVRESHPELPVIMLTANSTVKTAVQAMKFGAVDYLSKPFDVEELLKLIGVAIEQAEEALPVQLKALSNRGSIKTPPGDFGIMVGTAPVMDELFKRVDQLAKRDTTVLITGESGTGKELVAKEIHARSPRKNGPFIALNCAAIPESLIESELFGHEKGAFTHAVERRLGQFELANGGTLFLDEIGELSLPVQVKMLRFLQEQEFYRVGRSKPIQVDVRIVAATNKNLEKAVKEGRFRQDLYYRIHVVNVEMPPLRERTQDIPALVNHFIKKLSPLYSDREPTFATEVIEQFCRYSWPGNVRELENVVESILALSRVDEVTLAELPMRLKDAAGGSSLGDNVLGGLVPFEEAERVFETDIIMKALVRTNFVQTKAAELLGISRRILKYKMDKLGIADTAPEGSAGEGEE